MLRAALMGDNDEFIADFLEECGENLDQLDQELVALEDNPRDPERLKSIFRSVHTIKGSSGFFGFVRLGALAHEGETLLGKVRDGELRFNQAIASGLLKMVDAVREVLANIEQTGREGDKEYGDVLDQLKGLLVAAPSEPVAAQDQDLDATAEADEPEVERDGVEPVIEAAAPSTAPATPSKAPTSMPDAVAAKPIAAKPVAAKPGETEAPAERSARSDGSARGPQEADEAAATTKQASEATSIRVDVGLLDELMDFAGELVLARNALFQCNEVAENPELAGVTSRVSQITSEIQDRVMRTRMQPIGAIWGKFRRIVRDLSVTCGKEVRLELEGEETELDRSLLEAIRDPLTHIVRNAVDHGIESPQQRQAAGKPREGVLLLRARHESGQVVIEAIDDGAGINVDTIREKAVAKGLLTELEAINASGAQILQCIFEPGFSTAKQVSAISGRGVGMDVVKSHIEKIGGSVDLQSTLGQGTSLTIKIPLTLAIVPALMVGTGGQRFVIPQASLMEVITVGSTAPIEKLHNIPVYRLRDRLLPLLWLDQILRLDKAKSSPARNVSDGLLVTVLQVDGLRYGLVIDEVLNTHEIVVKPIGASIKSIGVYSAATILGDGSVAMILDVGGIARLGGLLSDSGERVVDQIEPERPAATAATGQSQTLLVCEVGGGREIAIPLDSIERLEELSLSQIKFTESGIAASYRGTILQIVALGGTLPWGSTLQRDGAPAGADSGGSVHVVVHRRADKLIGAAVQRIVDVVQGEAVVDVTAAAASGGPIVGMTLARGRVLEVMDLGRI